MPAVIWRGTTALVEAPTSPRKKYGEKVEMTRIYSGPFAVCDASAPLRGSLGTGVNSGFRVSGSTVTKRRGGIGELTVEFETVGQPPQGAQLPPDEVSLVNEPHERAIQEHSLFVTLTKDALGYCKTIIETANSDAAHADAVVRIGALGGAMEQLCYKLITKLQRGLTHYVVSKSTFSRTIYSWSYPANVSAGNIRQTPANPGLALPPGLSWLRRGDRVQFNGIHWLLVQEFLGAPDLDSEIYPAG